MEVEVLELKKMLKNNEVVLVDVREPYEVEICNIKGSLYIPMNEIPQNIVSFGCKGALCFKLFKFVGIQHFERYWWD